MASSRRVERPKVKRVEEASYLEQVRNKVVEKWRLVQWRSKREWLIENDQSEMDRERLRMQC